MGEVDEPAPAPPKRVCLQYPANSDSLTPEQKLAVADGMAAAPRKALGDGPKEPPEEPEARYFVALYDPSGVMMTAHKSREHLTLAEAKALQAEATNQGAMLLIYREPDRQKNRPEPA